MKRVAFRTKGNNMQGMGDILGSLSLAQEFSSRSYDVIFIIDNNKEAIEAVKSAGYKFLTNGKKTETKLWLELPLLDIVIVNQLNIVLKGPDGKSHKESNKDHYCGGKTPHP